MRLKLLIILLSGLMLINRAEAQEPTEESQVAVKAVKSGTRIVISTSGFANFTSYWLDDAPKLAVEFKSGNVVSKIDKEVIVNRGVIKRITSSYFGRSQEGPLKSLTFELTQKVPYKIWQEDSVIVLDIRAPLERPVFFTGEKELFVGKETSEAISKRLEAMDAVLMQVAEGEAPLEIPEAPLEPPKAKAIAETLEEVSKAEEEVVLPEAVVLPAEEPALAMERKTMVRMILWLVGLVLVSSLGFLTRRRYRLNITQEFKRLKSELDERDKQLEHERVIRKAVEETSLQREKEYQHLKDSLIKKGLLKRELSPEEKERPWVPGKSQERRQFPRLGLSRDYSRTIILRIESQNRPESLKSFAKNISSDGLCFETKEEFQEKDPVNLRLFFYGDIVPIMKIQAYIKWKRETTPINYYGVSFDLLEEKDKLKLNNYIQSKIGETTTEKT